MCFSVRMVQCKCYTYPLKSLVYELLRNTMAFDISKPFVLEGLIDLVCDPVDFLLGAPPCWFQVNYGNTRGVGSRGDHFEGIEPEILERVVPTVFER